MTSEITGIDGQSSDTASVALNRGFNSLSSHAQNPPECPSAVTTEPDLDSGPYQLVCTQCQCEFESDNGFDRICDPCNHDNYEQERGVGEYIFDNH